MKVFRDPIHGNISLVLPRDKVLLELIDTPEFQRLRRIKQLGTSYLTFHGAEHSRFTHSLGVMHLMTEALDELKSKDLKLENILPKYYQLARIAALLHDIGHGPFSHSFEYLKLGFPHHEETTLKIILGKSEINRVLKRYKINFKELTSIISGSSGLPLVSELLHGHFDIDRADYLLRDSHATGVKYGVFDLARLLSSLTFFKQANKIHLAVEKKGLHALEEFILARYFMYEQVYLHKTSLCSEFLFQAIFRRVAALKKTGKLILRHPSLHKLFSKETLTNYDFWLLDDHLLTTAIASWAKQEDPILRDLCHRFLSRKLFKSVETENTSEAQKLAQRSGQIANKLNFDAKYYVGILDGSLTPYPPYDFKGKKLTEIYILDNKKTYRMSQASDIIKQFASKKFANSKVCFPEEVKKKLKG
ncbi:MAG: HD domain-containing protein [Candidatus Gracilibacteria bacterium]|nr:HD domain-containing protein [Candidatus Gracilibacteria bacterium]